MLRLSCYVCESGDGYPLVGGSFLKLIRIDDGVPMYLKLEGTSIVYAMIPAGRYALAELRTPNITALFPGITRFGTIGVAMSWLCACSSEAPAASP